MGRYYKKELGRREFFKKAFAAGVVAAVPYSIFSLDKGGSIIEEVVEKKFDFGQFQSFLIRNGSLVIGKSNHTNVTVNRELIDITTKPYGYKQYLPGPWNFNVTMGKVYEIANLVHIREVLKSGEDLVVYFKAMNDDFYEGDCRVTSIEEVHGNDIATYLNIYLTGIGTLIRK